MKYLLLPPLLFSLFVVFTASTVLASPIEAGSFSTTWDSTTTGRDGESPADTITFTLTDGNDGASCSGVMYWEEVGNDSNNGSSTLDSNCNEETITFPSPGTYRVDILGTFPSFRSYSDSHKLLTVEQWGDNVWQDVEEMFLRAEKLTTVGTDAPNLSQVTSVAGMFYDATIFNSNINHWDVSTIQNFGQSGDGQVGGIFQRATSFNQPLNNWDVSNAIYMESMFGGATSFNQPLNNWDVSKVESFNGTFDGAAAFNQSLADWTVSGAVSMFGMFSNSGLSSENYSATLISWANQPVLMSVTLGAAGITYLDTAAAARSTLINTYGWTINDAGAPPSNNRFVTRWDTRLGGDPNELRISVDGGSDYNFTIDWGDETEDEFISPERGDITHLYDTPGEKTITITGNFPAFYAACGEGEEYNKLVDVVEWGETEWSYINLNDCIYLTGFSASDVPNVSDLGGFLFGLTSFDDDLSDWDISEVSSVYDIFSGTALSTKNYTKVLLAWSQLALQEGSGLGYVGGIYDVELDDYINLTPYCSLAQAARDILVETYGWVIVDGGALPCKTVTYTFEGEGTLVGDSFQYIVDGDEGSAVTAVPADGYRFAGWSDGSTANPRTDSNLTADISVAAIFESTNGGNNTSGTRIGGRGESITEKLTTVPVVGSIATFITNVKNFLNYLNENEEELEKLTPEERTQVIIALRNIIVFLLTLIPGV